MSLSKEMALVIMLDTKDAYMPKSHIKRTMHLATLLVLLIAMPACLYGTEAFPSRESRLATTLIWAQRMKSNGSGIAGVSQTIHWDITAITRVATGQKPGASVVNTVLAREATMADDIIQLSGNIENMTDYTEWARAILKGDQPVAATKIAKLVTERLTPASLEKVPQDKKIEGVVLLALCKGNNISLYELQALNDYFWKQEMIDMENNRKLEESRKAMLRIAGLEE